MYTQRHDRHHIGKCSLLLPILSLPYVLLLLEENIFPVGKKEGQLKTHESSVDRVILKVLTLCNGSSRSWMALLMASCGTYEDSPLP